MPVTEQGIAVRNYRNNKRRSNEIGFVEHREFETGKIGYESLSYLLHVEYNLCGYPCGFHGWRMHSIGWILVRILSINPKLCLLNVRILWQLCEISIKHLFIQNSLFGMRRVDGNTTRPRNYFSRLFIFHTSQIHTQAHSFISLVQIIIPKQPNISNSCLLYKSVC